MSTNPPHRRLLRCPSTNAAMYQWIAEEADLPEGALLSTREQTAGRGQAGNSWHSEPGANITLSLLLRPSYLAPKDQFVLSRLVAVALLLAIRPYTRAIKGLGVPSVKWPNDLYFADRKMAGVLIESNLTQGQIDYSIVGIGLNVNERQAPEHLPKFCSLTMITGQKHDTDLIAQRIVDYCLWLNKRLADGQTRIVEDFYQAHMYRRQGIHPFSDAEGGFLAAIDRITPQGELILKLSDGSLRGYRPKEIVFE